MTTILLAIIYLSFISLGLPDSLLGSSWTIMRLDLHMPLSAAGVISMIVTGGTIVSSFFSGRLIRRHGTGKVTFVSVLFTALALFGFSKSASFYWLCFLAIPLGLGAGAVDAALNNFIALNYKAKHMSWLHCFWGIGATGGPLIMSLFLGAANGWRKGYLIISIIQICLTALLFLTLPLWNSFEKPEQNHAEQEKNHLHKQNLFSCRGVKITLLSFFCYCSIEMTAGLWGSSYLVSSRGVSAESAAKWISLFYLGITIGRMLSGFAAIKLNNRNLIRTGQIIMLLGIAFFFLPLQPQICTAGFVLIGLGCAPIYPCMLHETPNRVGKELSQSMMGIQMAFAYIGSTLMPPVFGYLAAYTGTAVFPVYLLILLGVMILSVETMNRIMAVRNHA